jgi:hypothetical protein
MGLEGKQSRYSKLNSIDSRALVKELQSHGIRVLGSTIIGLENHTPENIDKAIDYAVSHDADFHQFMLYTPNEGTPLYEKHKKNGTLYEESEFPIADAHGQYRFNYRHQHIHDNMEENFLLNAFKSDFKVNGPSLTRLIQTLLKGWQRYKHHPDRRIQDRYNWEVNPLRSTYAGAVWAMKKIYRHDKLIHSKTDTLLKEIYMEFGWKTRIAAPIIGIYAYLSLKKEEKKLANGWTYESPSFYEKNKAALTLEVKQKVSGKKPNPRKSLVRPIPVMDS